MSAARRNRPGMHPYSYFSGASLVGISPTGYPCGSCPGCLAAPELCLSCGLVADGSGVCPLCGWDFWIGPDEGYWAEEQVYGWALEFCDQRLAGGDAS